MAETRWRAADPATIRALALEGLTALYHRPSGQTHLVTEPVPEILAALRDRALTVLELVGVLGAGQDIVGDAGALAARLEELADAGLVSRA